MCPRTLHCAYNVPGTILFILFKSKMALELIYLLYFSESTVPASTESFIYKLHGYLTQVHWTSQLASFHFYIYICFLCLHPIEIT